MDPTPLTDEPLQPPPRKGGFASLLHFLRPGAQPVPTPFRDSDFVGSEWGWSAFDAPSGGARE